MGGGQGAAPIPNLVDVFLTFGEWVLSGNRSASTHSCTSAHLRLIYVVVVVVVVVVVSILFCVGV